MPPAPALASRPASQALPPTRRALSRNRRLSCCGRSPPRGISIPRWCVPCKAKPTRSAFLTAGSVPLPSRTSWTPTSATSRPACATRCAQGSAGHWPQSSRTRQPSPDGRPSTWDVFRPRGRTSNEPPRRRGKRATPACWRSPRGSRPTCCSTSTAATRPSTWSAPPTTTRTPRSRTRSAAGYAQPRVKWPPPPGRKAPAAARLTWRPGRSATAPAARTCLTSP